MSQSYSIDETKLRVVEQEKDLGIIFTNQLSFAEHITTQIKKANRLAGMIRRSFEHMDKTMFKQLFTSIVRPHLEYGACVWNPHLKKYINAIESVQRRATKMVPGLSNLSYKERLEQLQLPTLKYRRYRGDMIEVYKIAHNLYDKEATKEFLNFRDKEKRCHDFRSHQFNLFKESCKKDVRVHSFRGRIVDQWNNLPSFVVEAKSLNSFKNQIDALWKYEKIIYDPEVDIIETTTKRKIKFYKIKN